MARRCYLNAGIRGDHFRLLTPAIEACDSKLLGEVLW